MKLEHAIKKLKSYPTNTIKKLNELKGYDLNIFYIALQVCQGFSQDDCHTFFDEVRTEFMKRKES